MAAVLFIVTIPTEREENRLKAKFLADTNCDNQNLSLPKSKEVLSEYNVGGGAKTTKATKTPASSSLVYGTFPKQKELESQYTSSVDHLLSVTSDESQTNARRQNVGEAEDSQTMMRKSWEGLREILSSGRRVMTAGLSTQKEQEKPTNLEIPSDTCMEIVLREILKQSHIENAVWTKDTADQLHQIVFNVEFNETYENILDEFHVWGIGDRERSSVSVMNCVAAKTFSRNKDANLSSDEMQKNINAQKQGAWNRFMNTVRSRLNVEQIVRDVRQEAAITFDFIILLVSAAILAAFGLIEDSTIFLASSMLISPLMGPIIATIFGTVIKDRSLRTLGLANELYGIIVATLVGFVFGMILCTMDERYGLGEGLTTEMLSRCELHSLLVGVFTAVPSGAAAAIAILGENIGSLVGVAISASLLPPAVNSGLLWALACICKLYETDGTRYNSVVKTNFYSDDQTTELAIMGCISMCLTISNVICIYIMGILVLKVKEIAPLISRNNREFWKHDIKIARDLKKKFFDTDAMISDEFAALPKEDQKVLGINYNFLRTMHLENASYQNTWSPIRRNHPLEFCDARDNYFTVHRFGLRRPTMRIDEIGTSYKLLCENQRQVTESRSVSSYEVPSNSSVQKAESTRGTQNETQRRKFIVTPVAVDPLHFPTIEKN